MLDSFATSGSHAVPYCRGSAAFMLRYDAIGKEFAVNLPILLACGFAIGFLAAAARGEQTYDYRHFLHQMIDLEKLATLPPDGETCRQFSSYDRASRIDPKTGAYVGWNANGDAGNFLRKDPDGHVLAEMDGPGCIVRIWSANPEGTLKIYLDHAETPQLEADFKALIAGHVKPIVAPFVGERARGANLYLPIPYQKHARVVVENPKRMYYHVNYRTYPSATKLPTWSMDLLGQHNQTFQQVKTVLLTPPHMTQARSPQSAALTLPPGASRDVSYDGPAAITKLTISDLEASDVRGALRDVVMAIAFDGHNPPQVWTPLGDFFGSSPGVNVYASLPLEMSEERFCSRWYMPFASSAQIRFLNEGKQDVTFTLEAAVKQIRWHDGLGYFHAKWRRSNPNTVFDWPFLECVGRGRYVGAVLTIFNPIRGWWGEGDEKIWVDGETFPSTFGTGSEDYFGYAWCNTALFQHAYHNQTLCEGPGNGNHTSVNRWHVIDNIPFQRCIKVTIEDWPRGNEVGKDYSCTTYWYASADSQDSFLPVPPDRRVPRKGWQPFRVAGAIEGEKIKVSAKQTTGPIDPQGMGGFGDGWSRQSQLWWRPPKAGEWIELAIPVEKAGEYAIVLRCTKARDYGIAQFKLNGKPIGEPLDCFDPKVVPTGPVELGHAKLDPGDAVLRVELVGKNDKSVGYMFGLDCVVLKPTQ